jgi:predicted RNA-binding Zn-ribbon protein involved in translation (DUF1610 family)
MKILKEYTTHHYFTNYKKCSYYCPSCGKKNIFKEDEPGDYYVGVTYICTECGNAFNILKSSTTEAIINQLKTGITDTPVSPKPKESSFIYELWADRMHKELLQSKFWFKDF